MSDPCVPDACRQWLAGVADMLIPAGAMMPAASTVDVAGNQLDVVLHARPELAHDLVRLWTLLGPAADPDTVAQARELDPAGYDALCLIVAGGYYTDADVRARLGYTGRRPHTVQIAAHIDEHLLGRVVARGPRYRDVPTPPSATH